jgi:anti-sigma regulatory factor (Ser/Thr protein kinase)
MPLGFASDEVYRQVVRPIGPGDLLLFYSDGITEARNSAGETFGQDRLMACVEAGALLNGEDLIESIVSAVALFSGTTVQADDLTCVAVKIQDTGPCPFHRSMALAGRLEAMPELRRFIHRFCRDVRAGDDTFAFCLELAVHELAVNIIRHGRQDPDDLQIRVETLCHGDRAVVNLFYRGHPFEAPQVPSLPQDRFGESGYGLFIASQCADTVVYSHRSDGLNCVSVTKEMQLGQACALDTNGETENGF